MAEHLGEGPGHDPALHLVQVRKHDLEESRDPISTDLHEVIVLRAV
jgi:hypothetical protein